MLCSLGDVTDRRSAGGKAYALSKLIGAGFTVPDGFVVTSLAFGSMTSELRDAIYSYFDNLQTDVVAVRSSAINEDGQDAAWAGQLDTYLNTTRDALIANIERCWQSITAPRAAAYAVMKSVEGGAVAVIVQSMVQSEVSGVAFSVHPVLQDATQIVIEAGLGLGEAIVSGQITPDMYIIDKETMGIRQKRIHDQSQKLTRDKSGSTTWASTNARGASQKLSDSEIVQLGNTVKRLEIFFRYPVDVEWAVYDGVVYVLQSRPITGLASPESK